MVALQCVRKLGWLICLLLLVGCSNGRGSLEGAETTPAQEGFTVGGTVSGLVGTGLVLQNNGGADLAVSANGSFAFVTSFATGTSYNVTVATQPSNPGQICTVANGSATIAGGNVTNIAVTCATGTFTVRGTVAGLLGSGLVLQDNGGDDLAISADGSFSFPSPLATGAAYSVTVRTQPGNPSQTCSIANAAGTVGDADVTNVAVTCATGGFSIGGSVSGMGSGLVLQNNGGDDLTITGNGNFVFTGLIASGAAYNVTVRSQPTSPSQTCAIANPAGTVGSANVTDIAVTCATNVFTIGGTATGVSGSGLVLQLNGGNDRQITMSGGFAFSNTVPSGTPYVVTVKAQPSNPSQTCSVANATGVVLGGNVTNVAVTCTTNAFTIGGTVNGLKGSGLVLQKNGSDDLAIASNGSFTFETEQASGTSYQVTVKTQPAGPTQTCTVADGSGTVGAGNTRNVKVTCATDTFAIGGAVSGLLGTGLVLQNNGGNDVGVDSSGGFIFPTKVASGAAYNVTVHTQPSNPTQACTVTNGAGTVASADITNIAVSCTTSEFTIGGTISGLTGSGLLLRNNGADDLTINAGSSFTFGTSLQSGATYNISIATQPTNPTQTCTLANASGTVGSSNVTDVIISCVTSEFTVSGTVSNLSGTGLVLQNNGTDDLAIAASGNFIFPASLPSGTPYNVTVLSQPISPIQICGVTNGSGTVSSANITDVAVSCITIGF